MSIKIYNKEYIDEYYQEGDTELGKKIYECRWDCVLANCGNGDLRDNSYILLDYGCGTGAFIEAAPDNFYCSGYDINPYGPYNDESVVDDDYDILTLWGVIGHLDAPFEIVKRIDAEWVFIATPNLNYAPSNFASWKHYKPGEHIHYYNLKGLTMSMACLGYDLVDYDHNEGALRDPKNPLAILTAVYNKL